VDKSHLAELIKIEEHYWWHVAKRDLVRMLLEEYCPPPAKIVEGGIGGGFNLLELKRAGYAVYGLDIYQESVEHCRDLGMNSVAVQNLEKPWQATTKDCDAVLMLDVVEHCANPIEVLKNARDSLKPGGLIMLTLPAYPFLMGPWDVMLGHHRRYTKAMLEAEAKEAGLKIVWFSHWNSFTLPVAIMVRLLERVMKIKRTAEFPPVSEFVNNTLIGLGTAERTIMKTLPVPAGVSIVAILKAV